MANRRLSPSELDVANQLLAETRNRLALLAGEDVELLWALRRKVYKELTYDEREKPMVRRKLKEDKWKEQRGVCPACNGALPAKYCVLDRFEAMKGYTAENTRLICQECDTRFQAEKRYS